MTSTRRRAFLSFGALAAAAVVMPAMPARANAPVGARTLADTLAANPQFARFLDLVTRAGAIEDLRQSDARTLFAPTDAGVATLAPSVLADLTGSPGNARSRVRPFVLNHLVQGSLYDVDLGRGPQRLRTLNGTEIELVGEGGMIGIRNLAPPAPTFQSGSSPAGLHVAAAPIRVVGAAIPASNGLIYPIDGVIVP